MPGPKPKPPETLRRRNAPEAWTLLPGSGCRLAPPAWPLSTATASEAALWRRLWKLPVAAFWHEQAIDPFVVARYVRVGVSKPEHAALGRLEAALGLTPEALVKLRLVVERPEPQPKVTPRYRHLQVAEDA
jgi:hypothetical protein